VSLPWGTNDESRVKLVATVTFNLQDEADLPRLAFLSDPSS